MAEKNIAWHSSGLKKTATKDVLYFIFRLAYQMFNNIEQLLGASKDTVSSATFYETQGKIETGKKPPLESHNFGLQK